MGGTHLTTREVGWLPFERLARLGVSRPIDAAPEVIVRHSLAMQAQDYAGAKWSIGLRSTSLTDAAVEEAIASGAIVRTWPMRGTLHFLASEDVRWMLALLAPRAITAGAGRRRQLEIDADTIARASRVLESLLAGKPPMTRAEIFAAFEDSGIAAQNQRGIHLLGWAAQSGLICQGPMRGKQSTFVLLDDWIPPGPTLPRDESLARLAVRYLTSHGPATAADLAWWAGLTLTDSRAAIASVRSELEIATVNGADYWMTRLETGNPYDIDTVHLLPGFDEFLLGYRDRSAVLDPANRDLVVPGGNGVFRPTFVAGGQVVGTWSRAVKKRDVSITIEWFPDIEPVDPEHILPSLGRYSRFLCCSTRLA